MIGQALWVVLMFLKGLNPSEACPNLTLRGSDTKSRCYTSNEFHVLPSTGCLNTWLLSSRVRATSCKALALMALACSNASAYDPAPLQDFCVAIKEKKRKGVFVNEKFCKDPKLVNANDFSFKGLNILRSTLNPLGSNVTLLNVDQKPSLNTLGISLARLDFAPYSVNPPHTHPRATEILVVVEDTLYVVGFVTSNPDNRLFTKTLYTGDVFFFSIGLFHFQFNVGKTNIVAFAGLSNQNPGLTIAKAVFGSNPLINPDVLTKAFQVDKKVIDYLEKQFN
ncbi:germin-like protein subfamily 1 member 13 [Alnus glutinosa]|uniref:germin-like protein subfamily 1 member 13 n=1 Tax=Alnus glutinosa TaxID=3517 RepID=UPI002D77B863|nr:germin-like protein subfamily 1 member 13 [Alnus glutinosa]